MLGTDSVRSELLNYSGCMNAIDDDGIRLDIIEVAKRYICNSSMLWNGDPT